MGKWMKRLASVLMACITICGVAACKTTGSSDTDSKESYSREEISALSPIKSKKELAENVLAIAGVEDDVYVATQDGKMCRMDATGLVKAEFSLASYETEKGIALGTITRIIISSDTKNIWAFTSEDVLLKLQESENGALTVLDYTQLGDSVMALVEKNNHLYLIEKVAAISCFKKFDLSKPLNEGLVSMGYLYKPEETGTSVGLYPAKNLGILSFEIMEKEVDGQMVEFAYIMHTGGLLRFSTDCSQNDWKVKYDKMYPAAYEEAYADAVAEMMAEENMSEDEAKSVIDGDSQTIKSIKKSANKAVVKTLGLREYDAERGEVEVPYDKFNKKMYDNHPADSVSYRGVGYSEKEQKYYIVTNGFTIITCDANQTFRADAPVGLATVKHEETDIVLPKRPEVEGQAMFYDKDLNVGYVIYTDDNSISRVDFNTMKVTFTEKLHLNIRFLVQGKGGTYFYYVRIDEAKAVLHSVTLRG